MSPSALKKAPFLCVPSSMSMLMAPVHFIGQDFFAIAAPSRSRQNKTEPKNRTEKTETEKFG